MLRIARTSWTIAKGIISLVHDSKWWVKIKNKYIRYKGRPGRVGYPSERSIPAFSNLAFAFEGRGKVALEGAARSLIALEGWIARSWVADGAMICVAWYFIPVCRTL